jgi:uncharacterized protein
MMKTSLTKRSINLGQSLLMAVCLNFITIMPSFAQEALLRTLTVTGQGEYVIPTTITQVQLGVEIQGKTAQQVQDEVAKRSTEVVNFLRSQKVNELQTTGISLQPQYDYSSEQRRLIGYVGINMVSFEVDTNQAGAILDRAVAVGATRIDNLSFTATDEAIAQAQQEALRRASLDAQSQAETVLNALNLSSQEIVGIQVNNATPPVMPMLASLMKSDEATTQVIGSDQTIRSSVTLQIRY